MLEPLHRDAAARSLRWTRGSESRTTPLALSIDLPGLPALPGALPLARAPTDRPTVLAGGSTFSPGGGDALLSIGPDASPRATGAARLASSPAFLTLDDDLPYPPAGGATLAAAAQQANLAAHRPGAAFVVADPAGAIPDDADVVVLGSARAYADNPYTLAKAITTLRANAGPERLVYLPGCGLPTEIALLIYAGADILDDATAVLAARGGAYVTPEGNLPAEAVADAPRPCSCPGCSGAALDLVLHARHAVQQEVARVRAAIVAGRLRELVEQRTRATPDLAAHLRRLDKECYDFFAVRAPLLRQGRLYATSKESLERPEIARFRQRLASRYVKPSSARILALLPCSATKPYSMSKTHRILFSALDRVRNRGAVHEVVLTSPLGIVPRELENVYPAAQYDLPVTGHWDEDEKAMIREALTALLARSKYDAIVVHLDEVEMEIAAPVLGDFHYTVEKDPLAPASLENLASVLNKLADAVPRVGWKTRTVDDLSSLARFQFGEAGHALVEGAEAKGKWPYMRLLDAETGAQLAMTTEGRGYLSLAIDGGRRLMETGRFRVEIDDFRPKGTIFAVGVRGGDPDIAPEDEVVLHHNGEFRGVGRAVVAGAEMGRMKKGACVVVRHSGGPS